MKRALSLATAASIFAATMGTPPVLAQSAFPHDAHSVFFSECSACHAGVGSESFQGVYPEVATCAACHDGSTAPAVGWTPPTSPRTSNLKFAHGTHDFGCAMCHQPGGEQDFAGIGYPEPATCFGCHVTEAEGVHLAAEGECMTCHLPLAESRLNEFHAREFPVPKSHQYGDFYQNHAAAAAAAMADCSVCHTETTCNDCHEGQGSPSFHPTNFLASHGPEAWGRTSDCSTCHNAEGFCRECHTSLGLNATGDTGVGYHTGESFWILSHAPAARQDLESCVSCHQQTDCLRCHSAQSGLGVSPHGPDFNASSIQDRNKGMCTLCHIG